MTKKMFVESVLDQMNMVESNWNHFQMRKKAFQQ